MSQQPWVEPRQRFYEWGGGILVGFILIWYKLTNGLLFHQFITMVGLDDGLNGLDNGLDMIELLYSGS